jgi:hypothetical protein
VNADTPPSTPADTTPADLPPAPDLLPPPDAPPLAPAQPLTWPAWFRPFDLALAGLAVLLAFLLGSFVARNPDLWRHLAAGRLITQFQYPVGGDPFTFTAESRPWVNAHWLGEVLLYILHSVDSTGAVAVGAKAIAFAAAIGMLFLLKKPGAPLWPWAAAAAAGAVAAGAFTHLRPQVFALPIMAGFMAIVYTADWAKGHKWRVPGLLGGLTLLWANVDTFAFLAPLMLGLILAGDWLDARIFHGKPVVESGDDPFRASPPRDALFRALLVCAAAVLLNPTFLGGLIRNPGEALAQLVPFELDFATAETLKEDKDLYRYTYSVFHLPEQTLPGKEDSTSDPGYLGNTILGNNPSGVFVLILWVAGGLVGALTFLRGPGQRHGRLSHLLVWGVVTLLAAVFHARFVPYAVLVGVPFLAAHLNGFGRWLPSLDKLSESLARVVLIGCRAGRVLTLVGLLALGVAAIPGWLHPWDGTTSSRRYVWWGITPDEGLKRAGETFAGWHADPARVEVLSLVRGLNTHPDLGDYLAYHAPGVKSYVTSRYRLHREELPDLVGVRQKVFLPWEAYFQGLIAAQQDLSKLQGSDNAELQKEAQARFDKVKPPVETGWLVPLADKHNIGYVSVAQAGTKTFQQSLLNVRSGFGVRPDELPLYGAPWHLDGRLMVVGRTRSLTEDEFRQVNRPGMTDVERAAAQQMTDDIRGFARNRVMTWDVAREVFGPRPTPPAPPEMTRGVAPQQGWENELLFLHPPPRPVGLDDADAYAGYIDQLIERRTLRELQARNNWQVRSTVAFRTWQEGLAKIGGVALLPLTLQQSNGMTFGPIPPSPAAPTIEPPSEQDVALPFLAARAARSGLIVDPFAANGYVSLAAAFNKPSMPSTDVPADLFGVSPLPPLGPIESQVQIITALRRAIARLPEPGSETSEYTSDALRSRVQLARSFLLVGWPQQVTAYRRVSAKELAPIRLAPVRVGYVDSARSTLRDLLLVAEKLSGDQLADVAEGLVPLWEVALQLCLADFWQDFPRFANSNQVPDEWWNKIDSWAKTGNALPLLALLVEADYLKKDDWTGWQDKFRQDAAVGKVDAGVVKDRLKRLYDVLDRLVGRRMGRWPKATDMPSEAFSGYVQSGLFETALKVVEVKKGDSKVSVRASSGDALRLMIWVGRAEDAQGYLTEEVKDLESKTDIAVDARSLERAKLRMVEYDLAKLNGDYAKAETLLTELHSTPMGPPPPLVLGAPLVDQNTLPPMTTLLFPELWRPTAFPPLTQADLVLFGQLMDMRLPPVSEGLALTGSGVMMWAVVKRDELHRRLMYQAVTHYQRGVFALLGGDPVRAREQFEKAADPQGVNQFLPAPAANASADLKNALPVQRLGPPSQVSAAFGQLLPIYLKLLTKYDAK